MKHFENLLAKGCFSREELIEIVGTPSAANQVIYEYQKKRLIDKGVSDYDAIGYILSSKSKNYHALDSFVYEYVNCGGVKDNFKIEINYMLCCHVLPVLRRGVNLP